MQSNSFAPLSGKAFHANFCRTTPSSSTDCLSCISWWSSSPFSSSISSDWNSSSASKQQRHTWLAPRLASFAQHERLSFPNRISVETTSGSLRPVFNCSSHRWKLPSSVWTSSPLKILSDGTELVAMASGVAPYPSVSVEVEWLVSSCSVMGDYCWIPQQIPQT